MSGTAFLGAGAESCWHERAAVSAMSLFKLGCVFIGGLFVLISVQFCRACCVFHIGL